MFIKFVLSFLIIALVLNISCMRMKSSVDAGFVGMAGSVGDFVQDTVVMIINRKASFNKNHFIFNILFINHIPRKFYYVCIIILLYYVTFYILSMQ